jgi:hypothetical protein
MKRSIKCKKATTVSISTDSIETFCSFLLLTRGCTCVCSSVFLEYGFHHIVDEGTQLIITVCKDFPEERLGISLLVGAGRLYVQSIAPTSLFATTDLEVNDLVESINGINFVDSPDLHKALSLAKSAPSTVTLAVRRHQNIIQ